MARKVESYYPGYHAELVKRGMKLGSHYQALLLLALLNNIHSALPPCESQINSCTVVADSLQTSNRPSRVARLLPSLHSKMFLAWLIRCEHMLGHLNGPEDNRTSEPSAGSAGAGTSCCCCFLHSFVASGFLLVLAILLASPA